MAKAWRTAPLPKDWTTIRRQALERDYYRCQHQGCGAKATDVDHIKGNTNHNSNNLQSLCSYHHRVKTSSEAGKANAANRRKKLFLDEEKHC